MKRSEKETREQLIDPKLIQACWSVLTTKNVIEKNKACVEIEVTGMPATNNNPTGKGYVDYVLFGDDGKPLALIEAKKAVYDEEKGRVQAELYAKCLEQKYGVRLVIYYTNGYSIHINDGVYSPRKVFGFHRKDELEHLIQRRTSLITNAEPDANICGREYQKEAIKSVIGQLSEKGKRRRSLVVLATGTGKTRVACAISEIFIRNNFAKRILFLADRTNLVVQAKEETFEKFMTTIPMATIIDGKITGSKDARIVFSTYQSMLSNLEDISNCSFGVGHFDLIIIDEAHRSIFNKYAEIFDYFDALMLGLTATPKDELGKSTYKVFNLENNTPTYEYDIESAVKDNYLTYFRALDRTPDILKNGITYKDLSDDDKEQYEEFFKDVSGKLPDKIEGKRFYSSITNIGTIKAVLRDLMEEGIKVSDGNVLGKTIIFAKDHNHALLIQNEFRKMYPELYNPNASNGAEYCVVIDNQIKYNEVLQREFKYNQDIRIVVSVDMMDTGVDVPEVVNLVFFKKVMSKTKFWQMLGRGTRLCDNGNFISPSKDYFERRTNDTTRRVYKSKQGFLVFDVCNVFDFFNISADGRVSRTDTALSLNQKVFIDKVNLLILMQENIGNLDADDKDYCKALKASLVSEVAELDRNDIGVQNNMKYVEQYKNPSNWDNMKSDQFVEIKKHIAPNIIGETSLKGANFFDQLCYKYLVSKFQNSDEASATAKKIRLLTSDLLNNKINLPDVSLHKTALEELSSLDSNKKTSVKHMEEMRLEIRNLIQYIDKKTVDPIISDFDDKIDTTWDAKDKPVDFSVSDDNLNPLREKAEAYIRNNSSDELVSQVYNLKKTTAEAVDSFKKEIEKLAKSKDEYDELFESDDKIVPFVRKTVGINPDEIDKFIAEQEKNGLGKKQLEYVVKLFKFISKNGKITKNDIVCAELNFGDLFDKDSINKLISDIDAVL